ncbi:MAG TPA: bifunctional DNA primase/polymerase [Polyangiaceae bacterium]|nr:bifunctional DNA primase/polymerase [Polyangiaceae bacterium]
MTINVLAHSSGPASGPVSKLTPTESLNAALTYAAHGVPIFPLRGLGYPKSLPEDAKEPWPGSRGHLEATTDERQIRAWVEVAGKMGFAPGWGTPLREGYLVVDVDPKHGGQWPAGYPETLIQHTPSGGLHAIYAVPSGMQWSSKLDTAQHPGVDLKGNGSGYIVLAPSEHPNGGRYAWRNWGFRVAQAPQDLVQRGWVKGTRNPSLSRAHGDQAQALSDEKVEAIAEQVNLAIPDFGKHSFWVAWGGWAFQRGLTSGDVEAVVRQACAWHEEDGRDAGDVEGSVSAAVWSARSGVAQGYTEFQKIAPAALVAELDRVMPSAWAAAREPLERAVALDLEEWERDRKLGATVNRDDPWATIGARKLDLNVEDPPAEAPIEGLPFLKGQVNALTGLASNGKTPTLVSMALAVANGVEWVGRPTRRQRVALLTYEAPGAMKRTLRRMARAVGLGTEGIEVLAVDPGSLAKPGVAQSVRTIVEQLGIGLLVIETYDSAISGLDANAKEFAEPLKWLEVPTCATVVSIHAKKAAAGGAPELSDIAGTGSLGASIKGAIGIHRPDPEDEFTFELNCVRAHAERFKPFRIRFEDVPAPEGEDPDQKWGLRVIVADTPASEQPTEARKLTVREREDQADVKLRDDLAMLGTTWHLLSPSEQDGLSIDKLKGKLHKGRNADVSRQLERVLKALEREGLWLSMPSGMGRWRVYRPVAGSSAERWDLETASARNRFEAQTRAATGQPSGAIAREPYLSVSVPSFLSVSVPSFTSHDTYSGQGGPPHARLAHSRAPSEHAPE